MSFRNLSGEKGAKSTTEATPSIKSSTMACPLTTLRQHSEQQCVSAGRNICTSSYKSVCRTCSEFPSIHGPCKHRDLPHRACCPLWANRLR
eukprot:scaffold1146_cov399-Prasinococcus_capsulatus_cf.AAC.30